MYRHDARARGMARVHPVPTAIHAAQWATQDDPVHGCKTLLIQNGRLLLDGVGEWSEADELVCPAQVSGITAGTSSADLMLGCTGLSAQRTKVLTDIAKLVSDAPSGAVPVSSARVAVPLPAALVASVNKSKDGAVPADSRSAIM